MVALITWYNSKKRMTYVRYYKHIFFLPPVLFENCYGHIVVSRYLIKNGYFVNLDNINPKSGRSSDIVSLFLELKR